MQVKESRSRAGAGTEQVQAGAEVKVKMEQVHHVKVQGIWRGAEDVSKVQGVGCQGMCRCKAGSQVQVHRCGSRGTQFMFTKWPVTYFS